MRRAVLLWWLSWLGTAVYAQEATEVLDIFFDFGTDAGDDTLPANDDSFSDPITISNEFTFFASRYSTLFVSIKGDATIMSCSMTVTKVDFILAYFLKPHDLACVDTILLFEVWLVVSSVLVKSQRS